LSFGEAFAAYGDAKEYKRLLATKKLLQVRPSANHIRAAFDEVLTFPRSRTAERVESDEVRVLRERLAKMFIRANLPPNVGMASQFLIDHAHLIDD
jgi:hypothetical protein